ncbi:hypothetical protein [Streptomyces sp. MH60]|uniref:hypothetical protein n=1 Tax=Streptomyces sp. MH60 TaxID=1940758 RepID=UPI000CED7FE5|nr:hypothetical protein [Streptomyces sp. MH60]PPS89524.1 hypothetical protein BZZ08_01670 [Streptomyces sp. MH60]
MKNTLKRAWAATGTETFFYASGAIILFVLAAAWYELHDEFDIAAAADTEGFRLATLLIATALGLGVVAGGIVWRIVSRYLPEAPQAKEPLPIDPTFPPSRMVYLRGEDERENCVCHDRPIEDGTEIWYWHQPAKLVCAEEYNAG